jgi:hypothetical protein
VVGLGEMTGGGPTPVRRADDAVLAVAAHAMLNSVAVAFGSVDMVRSSAARLSPAQVGDLLDRALAQLELVSGILGDLVRGLPPQLVDAMDDLEWGHRLPGPD